MEFAEVTLRMECFDVICFLNCTTAAQKRSMYFVTDDLLSDLFQRHISRHQFFFQDLLSSVQFQTVITRQNKISEHTENSQPDCSSAFL